MSGGLPHLTGLPVLGSSSAPGSFTIGQFPTPGVPPPAPMPRALPRWLKPDPKQPDTMGWRAWLWDGEWLISPHQGTLWPTMDLVAACWSEEDAVRGSAGIHARLVPRHWKIVGWPDDASSGGLEELNMPLVTGIVERFGRYVLGTEGWRAEQAIIRELMAPSTEIGLKLEQKYPDVIVHYPDQLEEGETACKSEKSSALEKGSRSLLPLTTPAPSPPPPPVFQPLPAPPLLPMPIPPTPPSVKESPPRFRYDPWTDWCLYVLAFLPFAAGLLGAFALLKS